MKKNNTPKVAKAILLSFIVMFSLTPFLALNRVGVGQGRGREFSLGTFSPSTSYPHHAPIMVVSDNYAAVAGSGSGTEVDPWIIENWNIECNGSGAGIAVVTSTDYAIFRNINVNESGSNPASEFNIAVQNSANVRFEDITCNDSGGYNVGLFTANDIVLDNVTITNSALDGLIIGQGSHDIEVSNSVIENSTQYGVYAGAFVGDYVYNVVFDNLTVNASGGLNMIFSETHSMTVQNSDIGQNTAGAEPKGIKIVHGHNQTIFSNTFHDLDMGVQLQNASDSNYSYNVMTNIDLDGFHAQFGGANDSYFGYNFIGDSNVNWVGDCFAFTNCGGNTFYNNTGIASFAGGTDSMFAQRNVHDDIYENNYATGFDRQMQFITTANTNITVENNTYYNSTQKAIDIDVGSGFNITNNTFIENNLNGLDIHSSVVDINTTYNNFTQNVNAIVSGSSALNVNFNWFANNTDLMSGTPNNWSYNYYWDYFDDNPLAISDLNKYVLNETYSVDGVFDDDYPLYHEAWYPRTDVVTLNIKSTVDGKGIFLEYLKIEKDGVVLSTNQLTAGHVLFRLRILSSDDAVLHDHVYNVNGTGADLVIELDFVNQVAFSFYSSIDGAGLAFTIMKLFVNGTRITTSTPSAIERDILVTVTDFLFNVTLYEVVLDLATTGIYVDIPLPIAPIWITNDYNRTVIFHLARGSASTTIALGPDMSVTLRLALGEYQYILTEADGTELLDTTIEFRQGHPEDFVINFGFTSITPDPITVVQAQLLDYVILMAIIGTVLGAVLIAAWWVHGRVQPSSTSRGSSKRKVRSSTTVVRVSRK